MTAFLALLRRDLLVAWRNALPLLAATLTQPILVVLVFGNILPRLGLVADQFRTVMVPGLMSITMLMAGVQGVLMPLVTDLSGSREVDERLLSPLSVTAVAVEKIVAGAIHAALAGLIALPAMMVLMHQMAGVASVPTGSPCCPMIVLCGLLSAAFGMTIGGKSQPRFSGLLFAVILGPMMLFGCAYYPYAVALRAGPLPVRLPAEPARLHERGHAAGVTPNVPHMPLPLLLAGLGGCALGFGWLGARTFERRTIL